MSEFHVFNAESARSVFAAFNQLNGAWLQARRHKRDLDVLKSEQESLVLKVRAGWQGHRRTGLFLDRLQARKDQWQERVHFSGLMSAVGVITILIANGKVATNPFAVATPVLILEGAVVAASLGAFWVSDRATKRIVRRMDTVSKVRARNQQSIEVASRRLDAIDIESVKVVGRLEKPYELMAQSIEDLRVVDIDLPTTPQLGDDLTTVQDFVESHRARALKDEAFTFLQEHAPVRAVPLRPDGMSAAG